MTTPQTTTELPLAQNLECVITWLEGGCDPKEAAKELRLLKERVTAAPQEGVTVRPNSQDWAGMDGQTAFLLIERHADGWGDINLMMGEWLAANQAAPESPQPLAPPPGYALVPLEPTQEMCNAPNTVVSSYAAKLVFLRMVAAAPQPPASALPLAMEALARRIFEHLQGWGGATFGWQDNIPGDYERAKQAHADECISRIAKEIAAALPPPGRGMVPMTDLRRKINSVAHVQEAVREMLVDEILADIAAHGIKEA